MAELLLDVKNLNINYDNKPVDTVKDFSMTVKAGEVVSIVGESGSGKTTVVRAIMGMLPANGTAKGEVSFQGKSVLNNKKHKLGKGMSMVFQSAGSMLNPILTIGFQFVEYIRSHEKISKKAAYDLACEALKKVNLTDAEGVMSSYPFELSGGMQQRVGIAMAIVFNPPLILADEPTSALDVTTQLQICELLKDINVKYNTSIVMVTHNLSVASYLSHSCLVLYNGQVVERGSIEEVLQDPQHDYTKQLIDATTFGGDYFG